MGGCMECIGRTPFASLLATIICVVGVCVFCGTSYRALTLVIEGILNPLFGFNVSWLEVIRVVFVILGVVMGCFAIFLLVFGVLATGATRANIYSGAKCIMGGRISAAFFMVISYILDLLWVAVACVAVVPMVLYASLTAICKAEVYSRTPQSLSYCFNLTQLGVYRNNSFALGTVPPGKEALCQHHELQRMCDIVVEAGPLFCVAFIGAVLIVFAMTNFLVVLAANYTRIKISKELTSYRDAVEAEELEMQSQKGPPPFISDRWGETMS